MFHRLRALQSLLEAWSTVAVCKSTAILGAAAGSTAGRPLPREAEQLRSFGSVGAGATAPSHMVTALRHWDPQRQQCLYGARETRHRFQWSGGGHLAGIAVDVTGERLSCFRGRPTRFTGSHGWFLRWCLALVFEQIISYKYYTLLF